MTVRDPGTHEGTMHHFLAFELSESVCAVPLEEVHSIVHLPALSHPPGMPALLEGFLNLRGEVVPVVRLDRLFELPEKRLGPYTTLVLLRQPDGPVALLVDRASEVFSAPQQALLPVRERHSFNECARAEIAQDGRLVHLLDPGRLLLEKERRLIRELQAMERSRIERLEPHGS